MKRIFLALVIIITLLAERPAFAETTARVVLPILMYHQISNQTSRLGEYVISADEFESDLQLLDKEGYTTIGINDLILYTQGLIVLPDKPIMLTFDDGFQSDYVYAFPLLKKYNMKAIFSVVGSYTDRYSQEGIDKHINYAHLSWEEIKEMHKSGLVEFQSHSYDLHTHKGRRGALKRKNESIEEYKAALSADLGRLNEEMKNQIGVAPAAFTCPFGCYNETLRDSLKDLGFSAILTSNQKFNKLTGEHEELYRLNRVVRTHGKNLKKLLDECEAVRNKANSTEEK